MSDGISDNIELGQWLVGSVLTKLVTIITLFREYAESPFTAGEISSSLRDCGVLNKEELRRFIATLEVVRQDFEEAWVNSRKLLLPQKKVTPPIVIEGIKAMMGRFPLDGAQGHLYAYFVCVVFRVSIAQKLEIKWREIAGDHNVFSELKAEIADFLHIHNRMQFEIQTTTAVLNSDQQVVFGTLIELKNRYKELLVASRKAPALVEGYVPSTIVTDGVGNYNGAFNADEIRNFQELERKEQADAELLRRKDEAAQCQAADESARKMLARSNQSPKDKGDPPKSEVPLPESGRSPSGSEFFGPGDGYNRYLGQPNEKNPLLSGKGDERTVTRQRQDNSSADAAAAEAAKNGGCGCCTIL